MVNRVWVILGIVRVMMIIGLCYGIFGNGGDGNRLDEIGGMFMDEYPQIMIGCPVGVGRSYVLSEYLNHIYNLDYPKKKIHIALLFNHPKQDSQIAVPHGTMNQPSTPTDETSRIREILRAFKRKAENKYHKITIVEYEGNYEDRTIQGRRAQGRWMDYFAEIRNEWIGLRCPEDRYVFSVDSDILVPRDSLKRLLGHGVDVVSLLIANGQINDPFISPNRIDNFLNPYTVVYPGVNPHYIARSNSVGVMAFNVMMKYPLRVRRPRNKYDQFNYRHVDPAELHVREVLNYDKEFYDEHLHNIPDLGPWTVPTRYGRLVEVDMTGACYLIDSKVLDAGVKYGFHHQGEDCFFCAMAQEYGFKLYCDYTLRADHIMSEQIFHSWKASKGLRVLGFRPDRVKSKTRLPGAGLESSVPVVLEKVEVY